MFKRFFRRRRANKGRELAPDEIFLDSGNLPSFNTHQFEGRFEKPIATRALFFLGVTFLLVGMIFAGKVWMLQIVGGNKYYSLGEKNRLRNSLIFAERGILYDRNGVELVWNVQHENDAFAERRYIEAPGFSHVLGYTRYPSQDNFGFYYEENYIGVNGVEKSFQDELGGKNGLVIIETDALGKVQSRSIVRPPQNGNNIVLTLDSRLQSALYEIIESAAETANFRGGAGLLMNVQTGELITLVSYPEYSANILANDISEEILAAYREDTRTPFLNRAISGLYTPGSIIKPYLALGALEDGVISPTEKIISTGQLEIPNPYDPDNPTIFHDWKAHGAVDMRRALAVSSNVYFYTIGGGFGERVGMGISGIENIMQKFGFEKKTGIALPGEQEGIIPTPVWKKKNFEDGTWRLGDTYNASIGQFGFQVTPIEVVRAVAAIANGGGLVTPSIVHSENKRGVRMRQVDIDPENFAVVREGMREVVQTGTAMGISILETQIAAKTGTAQVGQRGEFVNAWITGFWPFEKPRYAFVIVLESGPEGSSIGGVFVMREFLNWLLENAPEYLE